MKKGEEEGKEGRGRKVALKGGSGLTSLQTKKSVISSELQRSERTTEASSLHLCSCRGRTEGGKEGVEDQKGERKED